jgi:hypothetical protein
MSDHSIKDFDALNIKAEVEPLIMKEPQQRGPRPAACQHDHRLV